MKIVQEPTNYLPHRFRIEPPEGKKLYEVEITSSIEDTYYYKGVFLASDEGDVIAQAIDAHAKQGLLKEGCRWVPHAGQNGIRAILFDPEIAEMYEYETMDELLECDDNIYVLFVSEKTLRFGSFDQHYGSEED